MTSLKQQKGFTVMEGIIILIVLAIVVGGVLYLVHNSQGNKTHINKAINSTDTN
jgi:competence protein ComGC